MHKFYYKKIFKRIKIIKMNNFNRKLIIWNLKTAFIDKKFKIIKKKQCNLKMT